MTGVGTVGGRRREEREAHNGPDRGLTHDFDNCQNTPQGLGVSLD